MKTREKEKANFVKDSEEASGVQGYKITASSVRSNVNVNNLSVSPRWIE